MFEASKLPSFDFSAAKESGVILKSKEIEEESSLDPKRAYYVTASQAYRVMADFEVELSGLNAEKPSRLDVLAWIEENKTLPKVGTLKEDCGLIASGAEIKEAHTYYKSQIEVFSPGMESVAREIAMSQFIARRDTSFLSDDMRRGNNQEVDSVSYLSKKIGIDFEDFGENQKFLTRDSLGVTPDAVQRVNGVIVSCGELKNPKDTTHMLYLSKLSNQKDMLDVCPAYYWQAQCGLHVTGADVYHWASYHSEFFDNYKMVYVLVTPEPAHIAMLIERSNRVMSRVPEIVNEIKVGLNREAA